MKFICIIYNPVIIFEHCLLKHTHSLPPRDADKNAMAHYGYVCHCSSSFLSNCILIFVSSYGVSVFYKKVRKGS